MLTSRSEKATLNFYWAHYGRRCVISQISFFNDTSMTKLNCVYGILHYMPPNPFNVIRFVFIMQFSNLQSLPESNLRNGFLPMQSVVWHSATYNPLSNHTSHSGDCLHPIYSIWSNNFSMLPVPCHQLWWDKIFRSLLTIVSKDLHMSWEQNLAGLFTSTPHLFLWGHMKVSCNFKTSASCPSECSGLNYRW